ncbi:hypothetical protein CFK37_03545 [Virgibacillus phasianinus]|uniref:Uncharacterized protein n=1 Tax=Virgibacillus phasianinus TaxID=2017483 RepID=A0A220TZR4_9BACI|nr:hypothetical protein [Virgibacillus phasianinus]ASK61317.1 hypothetical protein CFK37_03545 [Virgibacillus phasianinus]
MKKVEWLIVAVLIIVGLIFLTVSGTTVWEIETIQSYVKTFIQLCLWMGSPVIIVGIIYIIIQKRKGR